jgi:hypothetical protein
VSRREERGNYLFNNATHTLSPTQRKRTREVTLADLKMEDDEGFCFRISALGKEERIEASWNLSLILLGETDR